MIPRTRRVLRKPSHALVRGERVTVTFEAVVEANGVLAPVGLLDRPGPYGLKPGRILPAFLGRTATFEVALPTAPAWRAGDVVVVRYVSSPIAYTYVRGARGWPGERAPKTDADMDQLFAEGRVTPVLQAGGEPFDEGRLP